MAKPLSNIEKKMSSGGPDTPRLNMEQFIKLADADKIQSDLENEIIQLLNEKFLDQKKPGESFSDWLKRTPREELLKLELSGGGKVIMLSDYLKQKEKPKIKKLDLDSVAPGKALSELTEAEREVVLNLLRMTFKD